MTYAPFDEYEYLERQLENRKAKDSHGDKDHDRDRKRSRDRDYESSERRRSRSRSRSKSYSRRSRSPAPRERDHHRSHSRHRSRSPRRERARTPPEVRLQREQERELRELERAARTVFAYNLNIKADARDVFEFFSKAGKITDIRIITDRNTRRSKGLAYIEFADQADVFNALALTGQVMMSQPVMVKASEAEKNLAWEAQQQAKQNQAAASAVLGAVDGSAGPCKLQVTNLRVEFMESDLLQLFEPFGAVQSVQVVRDAVGKSVGYGFVTFQNMQDGMKAMQHWNGRQLVDAVLGVMLASVAADASVAPQVNDLAEDEDGFKLGAKARTALMNRLANSAGLQPAVMSLPAAPKPAAPAGPIVAPTVLLEQGVLGPASPIPTPCILLKNMFDSTEQTEEGWDKEIAADVKEECSKFGPVVHVHVDPASKGFVYLKFASVDGAQAAQRALHGRWYSGRQVVAEFQFLQVYNGYFQC